MAITAETLRISDRIRRDLQRMTDEQAVALTRAWVEAWDVLAPEFQVALVELLNLPSSDGYVSKAVVAKNLRLRAALQQARIILDDLAAQTEVIVANDVGQAVLDAVDGHAAIIQSQLPVAQTAASVSFSRMSEDALAAIVARTTEQIHSFALPLSADAERVMKNELIRGIAIGDNPRTTARRILRNTEHGFNGGLTRALRISRTETLDAHRAATLESGKLNTDVLTGWVWSATLDARTCPSCLGNHGTEHPVTEFGPIDHAQGRCARIDKTKSWADLGFTGITEPADTFPDAQAWFDNLTPSTQREIMGAERLELLQSGKIGWSDLTTRKENPDWRASMQVTPVKKLRAVAA